MNNRKNGNPLGLLPRMEAVKRNTGITYRYHPLGGKPINLGRDYLTAIAKYHTINASQSDDCLTTERTALEMWRRHKKGAAQRKIEFALSESDIFKVMKHQQFRCAVTGLAFKKEKPGGLRIRPWMPSIDRIDSRFGYLPKNIRVVCGFVNVAMNGFGDSFFTAVLNPLIEAQVRARIESKPEFNSFKGIKQE